MADSLLRVAMAASSNGYRANLADSAVSGTLTASTTTPTPMNTTNYDPLTMGTLANTGKITVDVDGYYIVSMRTSFVAGVDGTRMLSMILTNRQGAGALEAIRGCDISAGGASGLVLCATGLLKLLSGDIVEGAISVSTAASTTAAGIALNTIEVAFVGPV